MKLRISVILGLATLSFLISGCQTPATTSHSTPHHSNSNRSSPSADGDHAGMKHDMSELAPMKSAPGAAEQPYDLQFIDTMIEHHRGAVVSSEATLRNTKREELKPFLQKVIDDQEKEIAMMKEWRENWYPGKPSALNMEMPGMHMSSHAVADAFSDLEYIDMMIPHHEGAILMAREAIEKAERDEIKKLAKQVINVQEAEIKTMKVWKDRWSK